MGEKRVKVWVQHFADRPHLVLQWYDPDTGKRKSKSAETADPDKAEQARGDLEADLNNGRHVHASNMGWERFRELFEKEYVAGLRPNTQRNHRDTLDHFERLCSPGRLRGVTGRTVSAYVAAMRTEKVRGGRVGMAPSTMRVRLEFLHTALQWAAEQKLIPEVPPFPSVKVPKRKPQPVPAEAFERLLAAAGEDRMMRAYLLAGWRAGLRRNEAYYLRWAECGDAPYLDLTRDRIILPAGFVKSDEDQWLPLDPELRRALEALPRHGPRVFSFPTQAGGEAAPGTDSARVVALAASAGVRLTIRALRRGFGCRYAATVPAQVLQRLMRHSNIGITMEYYANVDDAAVEAVMGRNRNTSRNNAPAAGQPRDEGVDATSTEKQAKDA
jgi:integrase